MPESQVPARPNKKAPATYEQKRRRRKIIRRILTLMIVIAVVGAGAYFLQQFVFQPTESTLGEPMTSSVLRSSIQSTVSGSGSARAKNSATVVPDAGSRVLELFVKEGDMVEKGQLLYHLDDSAAQEGVTTARENIRKAQDVVDDYKKELNKLYANMENLNVTAPHDGKLMEINSSLKPGYDASVGESVATVVNDTKLRLHLYYSYAYEGQITVGQEAEISLPALMTSVQGRVEQINYVRRVVPEGSVTFEVVFVMDNPGTLTDGMVATAAMSAPDGSPIYPYQSGKLEFYETTHVTIKASGPVLNVSLMNYADVKNGQLLVQLGDTDASVDIAAKQNNVRQAQKDVEQAEEALKEASKKLDNYHAVAPISGRVLSCSLTQGEEATDGASIYIADTATMMVDISIDERSIGYVSNGMLVDVQDQMENYYVGVVNQVALTAKAENGVASFPATLLVDNPDGKLMTGSYVKYTFVASQSNDCLVVPIQAVKNVTLADGQKVYEDDNFDPNTYMDQDFIDGMQDEYEAEDFGDLEDDYTAGLDGSDIEDADGFGDFDMIDDVNWNKVTSSELFSDSASGPTAFRSNSSATVCFVLGEGDERAIEPQDGWDVPEGFFVVLVETGLSDESNVEIKSGLREGDEVFTGYLTNTADSWGGMY